MTSLTNEQLLIYVKEVESAAEQVLADKQEIVDLDRRRNSNREAIRAIEKACGQHPRGDQSKMWLAMGNTFLRLPAQSAKEMLKTDQVKLDAEINILRSNLKSKVNNLRDKENQEELKGFNLVALSREELAAVRQVIGPPPGWKRSEIP